MRFVRWSGPLLRPDPALMGMVLVLVAAGCVDADPDPHGDDDRVIRAQGFEPPGDEATRTAHELLRLGSIDGDHDSFGRIVGIALGAGGELLVADGEHRNIRVFAPDGAPRGVLGGPGEGPGEFRMLAGLAVDGVGRVWGIDPSLRRITAFGPEPGQVRSVPHREDSHSAEIPWKGLVRGDSEFYELYMTSSEGEPIPTVVKSTLDDSGLSRDAAFPFPPRGVPMVTRTSGNLTSRAPVPFSPDRHWAVADDGTVWRWDGPEFVFVKMAPEGDTVLIALIEQDPPLLTAADRDSLRGIEGLDSGDWPRFRPAVHTMAPFDETGFLVAVEEVPDSISWYALDGDGRVSDRIDLELGGLTPDFSVRPIVRDGHLALIARDRWDVPVVVKFRID